ncbi:CDK5 and ABL1 enzyme substrate 2-like [Panonychus citri]|uniref:CDK5 and ABL1 enzyme substrate 2-like n=1 Tax=Panonychus citri TaxID=50023 RepID=UPI00230711D8|nr:CDK5 and ABL1 enzyme substrate 2-like [Panonychus citri]
MSIPCGAWVDSTIEITCETYCRVLNIAKYRAIQQSTEKRLHGNSLTFGGSGHVNGYSDIGSGKLGILDENGELNDVSPSQSRRQSCSLPLGQHCSSKEVRISNENGDEDTRGVLSSVGSCKRSRHNLSSSSILNHQLNSCESKSSIVTQQSHRSRNGSVNRGGNDIPLNSNKTITETTRHQVRFQHSLKEQTVQNEKIVFVASKRAPVALFSYIPFSRKSNSTINSQIKQDLINKRRHTGARQLSTIADGSDPYESICIVGYEKPMDGQEVSYSNLLSPTIKLIHGKKAKIHAAEHNFVNRCISYDSAVAYPGKQSIGNNHYHLLHQITAPSVLNDSESNLLRDKHQYHGYPTTLLKYNPDILDDPELITGKHSTLLDFPSYLTSIINYVKPSDLKKELNEKFRERFPYIQLTLSKMRSLKRDMCKIAKHEGNIDYLTVAQAYVYFEKLILKLLINKQNRKLCAGACLLLSAKLNDVKGVELKKLIEKIENTFRVDRKDLFSIEFTVLVALEFGLHLPINETLSHYQRLMFET